MIDSASTAPQPSSGINQSVPLTPRVRGTTPPALAMTADGLEALRRDLWRLREEQDHGIRGRLRAARDSGESSNNDEYLAIKEDEAVLAARIASLEDLVRRATVVDAAIDVDGVVAIGSNVSVEFIATGATACYRIVGAHEPPEPSTASTVSPIGQALLGRAPGEIVRYELPSGHIQHLRIVATRASGTPTA